VRWRGLPWRQTSLGGRYHGDRWPWWRTSTWNPTWNPMWNLNGRYWRAQKALLTCQYHSDSCRKIVLIGQFCESWIWVRRPQNQCESGIWNLLHWKQVVWLEDELAVTMMGSRDCCLNNFTLFKSFWSTMQWKI
jgi:hypothetical protein